MRDRLMSALHGVQAEYVEIHLEERQATRLALRGRQFEDVTETADLGGNVRACVRGGWGFISFNRLDDLPAMVELAVSQARLAAQDRTQLAEVAPVEAVVTTEVDRNPREVSLDEKVGLFLAYNDLLWKNPLQTSVTSYRDTWRKKYFVNNRGAHVEEERSDIGASFVAVARDGDVVQQAHYSTGSGTGFERITTLHEQVEAASDRAMHLLKAKPVKGGEYTVVIDPDLSGVFTHEAFGHLSESDHVYENQRMRDIMEMGRRFGHEDLNIGDGAAIPGLRASYLYDDEGTPSQKTYLIKNGVLVSRLHSRETAAKMGEQPTGNARALNYRFEPIVRMTNTFMEPGNTSFKDMIADIDEGVYAVGSYGGETTMEMFTFSAAEGYMIRHGEIAEPVREVVLTGNVFTTLQNIEALGNDFRWHQGSGCGKGGQVPLPVGTGGPHVRIAKCVVGGRS